MTHFGRLNLMEAEYPVDTDYDVVFCRNILIYFEPPVQQEVLLRLCRHLRPGGFLFLGHTESLAGFQAAAAERRQHRVSPGLTQHALQSARADRRSLRPDRGRPSPRC